MRETLKSARRPERQAVHIEAGTSCADGVEHIPGLTLRANGHPPEHARHPSKTAHIPGDPSSGRTAADHRVAPPRIRLAG